MLWWLFHRSLFWRDLFRCCNNASWISWSRVKLKTGLFGSPADGSLPLYWKVKQWIANHRKHAGAGEPPQTSKITFYICYSISVKLCLCEYVFQHGEKRQSETMSFYFCNMNGASPSKKAQEKKPLASLVSGNGMHEVTPFTQWTPYAHTNLHFMKFSSRWGCKQL